ncbi:hypothetical protein ACLOJK_038159 [Asimina triloba]
MTRGKEPENKRDVPSEVRSLPYESGSKHEILAVRGKRLVEPGVRKTIKRPKTQITFALPKDLKVDKLEAKRKNPSTKDQPEPPRKTKVTQPQITPVREPKLEIVDSSGDKPPKEQDVREMVNLSRVGFFKAPKGEVVTNLVGNH